VKAVETVATFFIVKAVETVATFLNAPEDTDDTYTRYP